MLVSAFVIWMVPALIATLGWLRTKGWKRFVGPVLIQVALTALMGVAGPI